MHASDKLELCILEILVLQDILNVKKRTFTSLARMRKHIVFLYKNRKALNNDKYLKYRVSANKYGNNILEKIEKIDSVFFNLFRVANSVNSCICGFRRSIYKRLYTRGE